MLPNLYILDKLYIHSKFVYQTRNLKPWLMSRIFEKLAGNYKVHLNYNKMDLILLEWIKIRNYWYQTVIDYFKDRPNDLLIIDYTDTSDNSIQKLNVFLNIHLPEIYIKERTSKIIWKDESRDIYEQCLEDFLIKYVVKKDWNSKYIVHLLTNMPTKLFKEKNYI